MRILTSFIIVASIIIGIAGAAFADNNYNQLVIATAPKTELDTIKFYAVSTEYSSKGSRAKYKVNGVRTSKKEYDKYHEPFNDISNCKPCYVKTYDKSGDLLYEGDQYTDCPVGYWKEYYNSGQVKIEGQYKTDSTGLWDERNVGMWCGIRHGKWTYYNQNGSIDSTFQYYNGVKINP